MQLWQRMSQKNVCSLLYHPIQDGKTFLPGRPTTHKGSSNTKGHQLRAQRFQGRSCWGRMGFGSCAQRRREGKSSKRAVLSSTSTTRNHQMVWEILRWKWLPPPALKTRRKNISCQEITLRSLKASPASNIQPGAWGVCHTTLAMEHLEK